MREYANSDHGAAGARQAAAVKEAAAALRRKGEKGELHFRIDSTGQPVRLSAEQIERDREEQDLRLRKCQVRAIADMRTLRAELDRKYR